MTNIKLTIEYHGLPYSGWQSQKNEKTVQDEIQKAIFKFSGEKKNGRKKMPEKNGRTKLDGKCSVHFFHP